MRQTPSSHPFKSAASRDAYLKAYQAYLDLWPVPYESQTLRTRHGSTHLHVCGSPDAPPLVLLHGAQATSGMWGTNVEAFSQHFRVYALDTIGDFGRSVLDPNHRIRRLDDYVTWLTDVWDALGLAQARMVGMSYGGWLTSHFALRHPDRVQRIALIAPAATFCRLRWGFLWRGLLMLLPFRRFTENMYTWAAIPSFAQNPTYRAAREALVEQAWMGRLHFRSLGFLPPTRLSNAQLQQLTTPTLLLIGDQEKIYDAERAVARARQWMPHIDAEVVSPASHDISLGQAPYLNERILQFLL